MPQENEPRREIPGAGKRCAASGRRVHSARVKLGTRRLTHIQIHGTDAQHQGGGHGQADGRVHDQRRDHAGHMAQAGWAGKTRLSATLSSDTPIMIRKPRRICVRGGIRPVSRPDQAAPAMMPAILSKKNQKYCVGSRCRNITQESGH